MLAVASTVLSVIAIGFSIFVFTEGRTRYKKDMFLKIHEIMMSESSYRGRQVLLSRTFDEDAINDLPLSERAEVSRALALYDLMGLYLRSGYLIEGDVISMWGDPADRAWRAAQPFVKRRALQAGRPDAYSYFRYLVDRARSSGVGASRSDFSGK